MFRIPIALFLAACAPASDAPSGIVDREAGDRTPLSGLCDDTDPTRCALPWPSSTFTGVDKSTQTGLRVVVTPHALPVDDDVDFMNAANGFSRISGIATAFEQPVIPVANWDPAHSLSPDAPIVGGIVLDSCGDRDAANHRWCTNNGEKNSRGMYNHVDIVNTPYTSGNAVLNPLGVVEAIPCPQGNFLNVWILQHCD